jgi:hypothetical protein
MLLEPSPLTGVADTDHSGGLTAHRKAKHAGGVVLTELITKQQFRNKYWIASPPHSSSLNLASAR